MMGTVEPKYNLLVSADPNAWTRGEYVYDLSRYLEHTDNALKARLKSLDSSVVAELTSLPTLIAYETQVGAPARVGWIASVEPRQGDVRLTFAFDASVPPIPAEKIESLRWALRIEDWEMNRTHWAVKQADLLAVLDRATALIAATLAAKGEYKFARQTLLRACDILKTLGHAELDRFVLEIGVAGLSASRAQGSRAQRTNQLAEYILDHPDERTAEGEQLAMVVVREAAKVDPDYPNEHPGLETKAREGFWTGLRRDGYVIVDGQVVPDSAQQAGGPPYVAVARTGPTAAVATATQRRQPIVSPSRPQVFIVHGRDSGAKHEVARFLAQLELEPIILHERPNGGRTLISKFQEESADIEFAVVLMTPDDVGGLVGAAQSLRARQNVIFELGFFIGKLGPKKVCALVAGEMEKPSDFDAVVYVPFGPATAWKIDLARELRHAGVKFNAERVF